MTSQPCSMRRRPSARLSSGAPRAAPMCALYAATFPERVSALVLGASYPRRTVAPGFPWGFDEERQAEVLASYETRWGTPEFGVRSLAPSLADDERFRHWHAQACRFAGTPASAVAWFRVTMEIDVRDVLPAIRVPTLVIHRTGDRVVPVGAGRYLAENIPDAKLLELPGDDHYPFSGDFEPALEEIEEFLTGSRRSREPDRLLATMLFTDIVGSTERAVELGDRQWKELLAEHHRVVRAALSQHRGTEVRLTGDGFLATFDGPARAIRCAEAIRDGVRALGLEIRAGLHTGEIQLASSGVEGVAVHIGARVSSLARAGEILVSSTVKDLVVGSGLEFTERGAHALRGVPGEWSVFAVA